MHQSTWAGEEEWIIWNGALGVRDFVTIGTVQAGTDGTDAWLEAPYDMVGPFSLDELQSNGCIGFAACIVMSRQKWQEDQTALRQEAFERRRKAQEELFEELERANRRKWRHAAYAREVDEREERELLSLPVEGVLEAAQIKAAYRRIAKKAHPDVGGSHEQFVRLTQARNTLLELVS